MFLDVYKIFVDYICENYVFLQWVCLPDINLQGNIQMYVCIRIHVL